MIPLVYFLLAWFVIVGVYSLMSLISVLQMVRLGISGPGTYVTTMLFLIMSVLVILAAGGYLASVDWQQSVDAFSWMGSSPYINP